MGDWWEGPCKVVARNGEHSYDVQVREDRVQAVHDSHLKLHYPDELGEPAKMWRFVRTKDIMEEEAAADEWMVEKILKHRQNQAGEWEFLVKWEGSLKTTWEELKSFIHRYNQQLADYVATKELSVDVFDYLHRHPAEMEAAVDAVNDVRRVLSGGGSGSKPRRGGTGDWEEPPVEDVPVELTLEEDMETTVQGL